MRVRQELLGVHTRTTLGVVHTFIRIPWKRGEEGGWYKKVTGFAKDARSLTETHVRDVGVGVRGSWRFRRRARKEDSDGL